jgi:hypothetical protein
MHWTISCFCSAAFPKRPRLRFASLILASGLLLLIPSARAQCDDTNPEIPPIDCRNPDTAVLHINVRDEKEADPEPASLSDARQRFWSTYPNGPNHEQARKDFAYQLFQRDVWLMYVCSFADDFLHPKYNFGDTAHIINTLALRDGIPDSAVPAFVAFVTAYRESLKVNGGLLVHYGPQNATEAALMEREIAIARHRYFDYVLARDWAEFDAVGKIPGNLTSSPDAYAVYIYARFAGMTVAEARDNVETMRRLMGDAVVRTAAAEILAAPKTNRGSLETHPPEIPGIRDDQGAVLPDRNVPEPPSVIGLYANQLLAFEQICARTGDKAYALKVLADSKAPSRDASGGLSRQPGKWAFEMKAYQHFVDVYGDAVVLQAAHALRTATKSASEGEIMRPAAIGAIHSGLLAAFMDVLARRDPAGPAKLLLAFDPEYGSSKTKLDATYAQLVAQYSQPALLEAMNRIIVGNYSPLNQGGMNGTGYQLLVNTVSGASKPCAPTPGLVAGGKGQAMGAAVGQCDPNGGRGIRAAQPK